MIVYDLRASHGTVTTLSRNHGDIEPSRVVVLVIQHRRKNYENEKI